jgi:hypothetical protein
VAVCRGSSGRSWVDVPSHARLVALLLTAASALWGCSREPAAPIPDPGGPFHTGVAANKALGALTAGEVQELCREISNAEASFLNGAVATEETCRGFSVDFTDAGAGFLTACQATYDTCRRQSAGNDGALQCPLPAPGCNAPVELVSACFNEMAGTDPISTCVRQPTCDEAAGSTPLVDAGTPDLSHLPSMIPACERLLQDCPTVVFVYPCH